MDCRQVGKDVLAFLESTLPPERAAAVRDHLSRCAGCRALTDFVAEMMEEVGGAGEVESSADLWPWLILRIQDYEGRRVGWLRRPSVLRPLAVGACLFVGAWGGIVLGGAYAERLFAPESGRPPVDDAITAFEEPSGSLAELFIDPSFGEEQKP